MIDVDNSLLESDYDRLHVRRLLWVNGSCGLIHKGLHVALTNHWSRGTAPVKGIGPIGEQGMSVSQGNVRK